MPVTLDIVTRALRRLRILADGETPTSSEAADALAILNDMMRGWALSGVDLQHQDLALADDFAFFVPPKALSGRTLGQLAFAGMWDASANAPMLKSGLGTEGTLYRVATPGTTALDGTATWVAGDYLVLGWSSTMPAQTQLAWMRGQSSAPFTGGVIDLLAVALSGEWGKDPPASVVMGADNAWGALQARFIVPDPSQFETGLVMTPASRAAWRW